MNELMPCPFCGNAKNLAMVNEKHDHSGGYFIACPECGASTIMRYAMGDDPKPLLIEAWNRRAALAAQPGSVGEQIMQLAHRWAQATYCKALGQPFEDFDAIQKEMRSLLAAAPTAVEPDAPLKWCSYCGEGVTTFCRGKQSPDWDYKCPLLNLPAPASKGTPL